MYFLLIFLYISLIVCIIPPMGAHGGGNQVTLSGGGGYGHFSPPHESLNHLTIESLNYRVIEPLNH